jgi:hypothetical protein
MSTSFKPRARYFRMNLILADWEPRGWENEAAPAARRLGSVD